MRSEYTADNAEADNAVGLTYGWEEPAAEPEPKPEPAEDAIQLYLREIGQVSLLTAAQEVSLAQRIERGKEARLALEASPRGAERAQLERLAADGALARQELIQANLRLVVSVAK